MRLNYEGGGSPWDPAPGLTVEVRLKDARRNTLSKQLSEKDIVQIFKDDINAEESRASSTGPLDMTLE